LEAIILPQNLHLLQKPTFDDFYSDNGELKFADAADSRYTMFNNSGYGSSLYMADYFINMFKDRKDPRLFTFASRLPTKKQEKQLQI
jgi:hypothetical protein